MLQDIQDQINELKVLNDEDLNKPKLFKIHDPPASYNKKVKYSMKPLRKMGELEVIEEEETAKIEE